MEEITDKAIAPVLTGEDLTYNRFGYKIPNGYEFDCIKNNEIIIKPKQPQYPKTYEDCCKIMVFYSNILNWNNPFCINRDTHPYIKHLDNLMESFYKLLICRNAYWKIAGEEMGLGKPWEPDWTYNGATKYCIGVSENKIQYFSIGVAQYTLAFPTAEMRDAFKENFDPDIEICKEFL